MSILFSLSRCSSGNRSFFFFKSNRIISFVLRWGPSLVLGNWKSSSSAARWTHIFCLDREMSSGLEKRKITEKSVIGTKLLTLILTNKRMNSGHARELLVRVGILSQFSVFHRRFHRCVRRTHYHRESPADLLHFSRQPFVSEAMNFTGTCISLPLRPLPLPLPQRKLPNGGAGKCAHMSWPRCGLASVYDCNPCHTITWVLDAKS